MHNVKVYILKEKGDQLDNLDLIIKEDSLMNHNMQQGEEEKDYWLEYRYLTCLQD